VQDLNLMSPVRNLSLLSPCHRDTFHAAKAPTSQAAANSILLSDDIMVTCALDAPCFVLFSAAPTLRRAWSTSQRPAALTVLGHGCEQALVTKEMDLTTAMNARAVCKSWRRLVKASILRSTFCSDFCM
jgi:hypothetical protein